MENIKKEEIIKCLDPFQGGKVSLTIPKRKIYEALMFIYILTKEDNLDNALILASRLIDPSNRKQRNMYSLVDTIYQYFLDGLIEPKDFNIIEAYQKIVLFLNKLKAKKSSNNGKKKN
jgi:hypothetical protein